MTDTIPDGDLARLVDLALEQADEDAPVQDALDAAVAAHGRDAVIRHLRQLGAGAARRTRPAPDRPAPDRPPTLADPAP